VCVCVWSTTDWSAIVDGQFTYLSRQSARRAGRQGGDARLYVCCRHTQLSSLPARSRIGTRVLVGVDDQVLHVLVVGSFGSATVAGPLWQLLVPTSASCTTTMPLRRLSRPCDASTDSASDSCQRSNHPTDQPPSQHAHAKAKQRKEKQHVVTWPCKKYHNSSQRPTPVVAQ
jgi:hypothetical protein